MIYQILTGQIDPTQTLGLLIALVLGITVHEFGHAAMATWLGDPTPRQQGRLSLAPAAHLDVMGSLMFVIGGFGWGRPVQYNPYAIRTGPRVGGALVAVAGPTMNIVLAFVFSIATRLVPIVSGTSPHLLFGEPGLEGTLYTVLIFTVYYNLMLALFNLIPIPPLDGFAILQGILPAEFADRIEILRQYGFLILMLLLFAGGSIIGPILNTPLEALLQLFVFVGA